MVTPVEFSPSSKARLAGVSPELAALMYALEAKNPDAFEISEGMRDRDRQAQMVAEGKSQTMNSKHLTGNAVDIVMTGPDGQPNWDFEAYRPIADKAKALAAETGVPDLVWGGDWRTLKDGVHFQIGGQPASGAGNGGGTYASGGGSGGSNVTMSSSGGPAMTPFVERQSVIKQLLGGEGLQGKLAGMFNPLEGANPRLEQERFQNRRDRFDNLSQRNAVQMANASGPVHWTQALAGIGADLGSNVMGGAAERAGGQLDTQMQELLASGQMTPEVLARIAALDPEYGRQLAGQQRQFEQQRQLQEEERAFTLQRDAAAREHEMLMSSLAPADRTAMEQQLIAAGYDPNGPVGEDGLTDFQREMRKQIAGESAGGDQLSITFDDQNRPIIQQGPNVVPASPGAAPAADVPLGTGKIDPGMAQGVGPNGEIIQAPVPGSAADLERQAAEAAGVKADQSKIRAGKDVLDAIDQVEGMIDWKSTGFVGKLSRDLGVGGTPAVDLEIALRPIVANLGFDRLQEMRAASQTGAALGQVTERENTLLQSTIKSLDPNGSPELLKENLGYVKEIYDVIINTDPNNPEDVARYEAVMGYPLEQRGGGQTVTGTTPPPPVTPPAATTAPGAPVTISTDAEYDALPSGTQFVGPDGKVRVKP